MIAREVMHARLRPGWRLAIALPLVIALAIGGVELGSAVLDVLQAGTQELQIELDPVAAWPADAGCEHGGAVVAAVALGAGIVVLGVLLGATIAGRSWRRRQVDDDDDGDDGDGGDDDELELPFDAERVLVIAVPRRDAPGAPGAPAPGKAEAN